MENEDKLKLQAWLDGELPPHKASRVADLVEANSAARELAEELRAVKVALRVGELSIYVEDSREFYWEQIARRIEAEDIAEPLIDVAPVSPWMEWCRQWLVPVGGLGAIVVMIATLDMPNNERQVPNSEGGTVEPFSDNSPASVVAPKIAPAAFTERGSSDESEIPAENVNILNLPTDGNPNLQPRLNERIIPSIENPEN